VGGMFQETVFTWLEKVEEGWFLEGGFCEVRTDLFNLANKVYVISECYTVLGIGVTLHALLMKLGRSKSCK
jgi:hypothetical protein